MPQCSPIQNLPSKLQFMLLHFLNICFLYHPLPQTVLQFIHILGLTLPFPNTLIYQWSHRARITKPAKTSMNQINRKTLSRQNIDIESLKILFNKGKDVRTTVFSCVPIQPLLVLTKVTHNAVGDPWAAHVGKAGLLLPTQLLQPSPFPYSCPTPSFSF